MSDVKSWLMAGVALATFCFMYYLVAFQHEALFKGIFYCLVACLVSVVFLLGALLMWLIIKGILEEF